jgi:mRNA interferase RelE/StbE
MYSVKIKSSAAKEFQKLTPSVKNDVIKAIEQLKSEPRGQTTKKLSGRTDSHRIRVRDYRILFIIDDAAKVVTIVAISKRDKAYK